MARTTLLDTRTVNYQELIGNGRAYFVPPYQRDYSWRQEQWEDLWNDITDMLSPEDSRHYMGALVVEAQSDRRFVVIDGQQRLATLSVLALAVIDALLKLASSGVDAEENRARARELRNRFIGEKDPASLVESSRLNLNETDNGFYQDYLVQLEEPGNPRGLRPSNRLLWECFQYFGRQIRSLDAARDDGRALASLMSETVARRLIFILITVDDALNAYTVIETLNARGLELTTTDLLKNYIFAKASDADRPSMLRGWQRIADTVGQKRVPDVLRYHLLCEQPQVRRRRLFKLVRDRYKSARDVFNLLRVLEKRAELFAAVLDPIPRILGRDTGCTTLRDGTQAFPCNSDDAAVVCGLGEMVAARLCTDVEARIGGGVPIHGSEQVKYQRTGTCLPSREQGSRGRDGQRTARALRGTPTDLRDG